MSVDDEQRGTPDGQADRPERLAGGPKCKRPNWEHRHDGPPWAREGTPWPDGRTHWQPGHSRWDQSRWGEWDGGQSRWGPSQWGHRRRPAFLFLGLAGIFGLLVLFVLAGMTAVVYLLLRGFAGNGAMAIATTVLVLVMAVAFTSLAGATAIRAFRGIARPLSDLMGAADAVAAGNLDARVPVRGHGGFARLAAAFNNMTEELSRADQRRRNLTADVAHELRTPLHIIQGNLEGVLDGVYEPTREHIEATLEETRALARLVEDLRTLSLAEAGKLELVQERVDVVDLLSDAITSFSGQAEAAGIQLGLEMAEAARGVTITGDAGRLDQVLSNLVANALRHTPGGGTVTLTASAGPVANLEPSRHANGEDPGGVRIEVRDTGEGIPPEDLPYVFDRFWRGDRSRDRGHGAGSGLGLAIARQLIAAHHGRITVESEMGQGTVFTIDLPAAPPVTHPAGHAPTGHAPVGAPPV